MEDFEVPSFSLGLGLDDAGPFGQTLPNFACHPEDHILSNASGTTNTNAVTAEADSDFESFPRTSIRILKRLKRGSSQACADSFPKQEECPAPSTTESKLNAFQGLEKANLPDEYPASRASESKVNAVQSFWKSLHRKKTDLPEAADVKPIVAADEDDIEEYSSEDDFQLQESCPRSTQKPSLCGKAAAGERFSFRGASIGSIEKDILNIDRKTKAPGWYVDVERQINGNGSHYTSKAENFRGNRDDVSIITGGHNDGTTTGRGCEIKQSPNFLLSQRRKFENTDSSCSDCNMLEHNDSRLNNLLAQRFPHFLSISALLRKEQTGSEQVYIDYVNQFADGENGSATSELNIFKKQARRSTPKQAQAIRKRQKEVIRNSDGWVQPGNATPVNATRKEGDCGPGHWVTERTGKRIYITRDGRKLSGSSAYKQHIKDSGKLVRKTRRRRPRSKK